MFPQHVAGEHTDKTAQKNAGSAKTTLPVIGSTDSAPIVTPAGNCLCANRVTLQCLIMLSRCERSPQNVYFFIFLIICIYHCYRVGAKD